MDNTFKALSDPSRRKILNLLKHGEMNATQISDNFNLSKATISHHLLVLKKANLITMRQEKNTRFYTLKTSVLEDSIAFLYDLKKEKK